MDPASDLTDAIARNIAAVRAQRGFSLERLAERSGVSKGMLVQIEQRRTNPSVGTLVRIAHALGTTVARLVESSEQSAVRVVAAAEMPVLWHGAHGGTGQLLAGSDSGELLELWTWRLEPGERHESVAHPPGAREILHIAEGTLTLEVGGQPSVIDAPASVVFRADRPHAYANAGDGPVRIVMVVCEPAPDTSTP